MLKITFKRAYKWLLQNFWLKLLALIFAIIIWGYVLVEADPMRDKVFDNVPIAMVGLSNLQAKGLTLEKTSDFTAQVTVNVLRKEFSYLTRERIVVQADLKNVLQEGLQNIPLTVVTESGKFVSVSPTVIQVNIRPYVQNKKLPVVFKRTGKIPENIWASEITAPIKEVRISGAKELVERATYAEVSMNVSDSQSGVFTQALAIEVYDKDGIHLSKEGGFTLSQDTVTATISIYPMRELSINAKAAVRGTLPWNMQLSDVSLSQDKVFVAGPIEVLDKLSDIRTKMIDVVGKKETFTIGELALQKPDGIVYLSQEIVSAMVHIMPKTYEQTRTDFKVYVGGVYSGAVVAGKVTLYYRGTWDQIAALKITDIGLYVDIAGLSAGTYDLPIKIMRKGTAIPFEQVWAQPATLKVTIK